MHINSISATNYSYYPSSTTEQKLEFLIQELRQCMGNHSDPTKCLEQIEDLLGKNKDLLLELCAMNGYSNTSNDFSEHYATFLTQAMFEIQKYIDNPKESELEFINEAVTQLNYLISHHK